MIIKFKQTSDHIKRNEKKLGIPVLFYTQIIDGRKVVTGVVRHWNDGTFQTTYTDKYDENLDCEIEVPNTLKADLDFLAEVSIE